MSLENDINEIQKAFEWKPVGKKCPKCGREMTIGSSHSGGPYGQWECHGCGHIEEVMLGEAAVVSLAAINAKPKDKAKEVETETEPVTEPTTTPETPVKPSKPMTPIRPMPGIQPKPKAKEVEVETEPATEPTTTPETPTKPSKPFTPIRPMPGIQPKPKAFNADVEMFLKKRGLKESEELVGEVLVIKDKEGKILKLENLNAWCKRHSMDIVDFVTADPRQITQVIAKENPGYGSWSVPMDKHYNESRINEADPLKGVHPQKREYIETGDETLNKILPQLSPEEQRYLKTIASETYQETIRKIQAATGMAVRPSNYPALVGLMMQTLQQAHDLESAHKQQLEEMALDLVFSIPEFRIVEEAYLNDEVGFDIKLGSGELSKLLDGGEEAPEEGLSKDEELNLALADALKDTSDEDLRRRFANLMITGGSYNKLHLYNMAREKLERIDEDLPTYYGILASMAQLGYWITPFGWEQGAAGGGETSAGSEEVIPKGDKYIIKARGTTFPYLVYELIKGIYEYLALDPSQQIAMQKDQLEDETKDMIAGPGVYKAIASYIPADKQEILPIVQKKLTALKAEDIRNVLAKNAEGQAIMKRLMDEATRELEQYHRAKEEHRRA